MPLVPGEAESVAASNAQEAADRATARIARLEQRLRELEAHVGKDTRTARERVEDTLRDRGLRPRLAYMQWDPYTRERNPLPCIVVLDHAPRYRGATWEDILAQL